MTQYHEFSAQAVNDALATAQEHNQGAGLTAVNHEMSLAGGGEFFVHAECISITIENHKVCLNLPLHIGRVCLPIPPIVPNGMAAQACLGICTTWGIPTGVRVTVSALGHVIIQKTFGKC